MTVEIPQPRDIVAGSILPVDFSIKSMCGNTPEIEALF